MCWRVPAEAGAVQVQLGSRAARPARTPGNDRLLLEVALECVTLEKGPGRDENREGFLKK